MSSFYTLEVLWGKLALRFTAMERWKIPGFLRVKLNNTTKSKAVPLSSPVPLQASTMPEAQPSQTVTTPPSRRFTVVGPLNSPRIERVQKILKFKKINKNKVVPLSSVEPLQDSTQPEAQASQQVRTAPRSRFTVTDPVEIPKVLRVQKALGLNNTSKSEAVPSSSPAPLQASTTPEAQTSQKVTTAPSRRFTVMGPLKIPRFLRVQKTWKLNNATKSEAVSSILSVPLQDSTKPEVQASEKVTAAPSRRFLKFPRFLRAQKALTLDNATESDAVPSSSPVPLQASPSPEAGPSQVPLQASPSPEAGPSQVPLQDSPSPEAGPSQVPLQASPSPEAGPSQVPLQASPSPEVGPSQEVPKTPSRRCTIPAFRTELSQPCSYHNELHEGPCQPASEVTAPQGLGYHYTLSYEHHISQNILQKIFKREEELGCLDMVEDAFFEIILRMITDLGDAPQSLPYFTEGIKYHAKYLSAPQFSFMSCVEIVTLESISELRLRSNIVIHILLLKVYRTLLLEIQQEEYLTADFGPPDITTSGVLDGQNQSAYMSSENKPVFSIRHSVDQPHKEEGHMFLAIVTEQLVYYVMETLKSFVESRLKEIATSVPQWHFTAMNDDDPLEELRIRPVNETVLPQQISRPLIILSSTVIRKDPEELLSEASVARATLLPYAQYIVRTILQEVHNELKLATCQRTAVDGMDGNMRPLTEILSATNTVEALLATLHYKPRKTCISPTGQLTSPTGQACGQAPF